ncbi:nuclear transport factor 2 family protein [Sphingobium sp. HWE2-09]|uniref:nuclear transport factor 2 family protein n=1 Tax=Sphingobium sp. HWE2-09 TaxID=3108390 RepID=UPI002DCA6CEF|nr:nuclear transport factor 2 family protein [Sphingobium sp. HWE2-09]
MSEQIDTAMTPGVARRTLLAGVAAAAAIPVAARAQSTPAQGPEEKRAIALVRAWADALVAKDVDKLLSLMDDAVQYRDDPFQTDLKKGLTALREDVNILLRGLTGIRFESLCAVGSAKNDVLVLARRVDQFSLGGKLITMPMGAYYRVHNRKILEWLDTPLADMPPPPPGAVLPGGPPPGGPLPGG